MTPDPAFAVVCYLLLANLAGFCSMGLDKAKAARQAWRIPERTLFAIALLGGSIGSWAGMYAFRHKTKHLSFVLGIPAILIAQVAAVVLWGKTLGWL